MNGRSHRNPSPLIWAGWNIVYEGFAVDRRSGIMRLLSRSWRGRGLGKKSIGITSHWNRLSLIGHRAGRSVV